MYADCKITTQNSRDRNELGIMQFWCKSRRYLMFTIYSEKIIWEDILSSSTNQNKFMIINAYMI